MDDLRLAMHRPVWVLVGLFLLLAALLKAYQLSTAPTAEDSVLTSRWFLAIIVEFEVVLGLLLILDVAPRVTRWLSLATFAVFAAVSGYKALSGEVSCGCFGQLEVNPWWTLVVDVACFVAIMTVRPRSVRGAISERFWASRRSVAFVLVAVLLAAPIGVAIFSFEPGRIIETGKLVGEPGLIVLEPETWLGNEFPLAGYIDIGDELVQGSWIIVLYHQDCPKCQEAIAEYERRARRAGESQEGQRIALVELPPYGVDERTGSANELLRYGRLTDTKTWFASTPCEIQISNGLTQSVSINGAGGGE